MSNAPDALGFPCKSCGAKLAYDAASQGMACPFCGHKEAVAAAGARTTGMAIRKIPLEEGLQLAQRGLGAQVSTIGCKDCGATVNVGQGERTTLCAFCGSAQVLAQSTNESAIRPESLLPFRIAKDDANRRFGAWIAALWFRPNDLKKIARVQEMGGVYVPFWTFDALVDSRWTAERGWHYYETETYTETVNGREETRTRQVQRTRWESASGWRQDLFDDVLVCAGKALPHALVEKFSSFDTKALVPYKPEFLAGWHAEAYAVDLMPGFQLAQGKMSNVQQGRCAGDVGGDTHRGLSVTDAFSQVTFKHVLLPIWIAAYRYNQKVYRFLVNGQSGEIVGEAPLSFWKIFFLVAAILVVIGGILGIYSWQTSEGSSTPLPAPTATATAVPVRLPPPTVTATATATTTAAAPASAHAAKPAASGKPSASAPKPSASAPKPAASGAR